MAAEYLERTPTSTGNRSVYTWAGWVKRNKVDQDYYLFSSGNDTDNIFYISIRRDANNNNLTVLFRDGDSTSHTLVFNNNSFRDPGSWMHFVVSVNTTIVDPKSDRCKVYINGARLTGWTTDQLANLNQNSLTATNAATETCAIGDYSVSAGADVEDFQLFDYFLVDGQALTPDVFGFYKDGDGYQSSGTTNATDFRPGQWSPRAPKSIKHTINRSGGFGANGFYLPMNDSSNPGADFHCTPNSIITLKGEDLPQPQNGAPTTSDAYVSQLRTDPYAANLVLAVPGISTTTDSNRIVNGNFDSTNLSDWTTTDNTQSWNNGQLQINRSGGGGATSYQTFTTEVGKRYTVKGTVNSSGSRGDLRIYDGTGFGGTLLLNFSGTSGLTTTQTGSFTASSTTTSLGFSVDNNNTTIYVDNIVVKQEDVPRDYSADIKGSGSNRTPTAVGSMGVGYEIPGYYGSAINAAAGTPDALYYDLDGSGANAYGTGDFTFECWFYATEEPSNWGILLQHATNASWTNGITLASKYNTLRVFTVYTEDGSSYVITEGTTNWALNQWHHVVAERYNGQLTLYLNGVAENTRTDTRNYAVAGTPASSAQYSLSIGAQSNGDYQSDGYIQDVRVYKGLAKYKGGFDVPKPYTPVGIEAFRTTTDTCKNNFATLNSLYLYGNTATSYSSNITLSDGNLTADWTSGTGSNQHVRSNIAMTSGKWYFETRMNELSGGDVGIAFENHINDSVGFGSDQLGFSYRSDGQKQNSSISSFADAFATGDIIGCAYDADAGSIQFYKNGVSQGTAFTGISVDQSAYFGVGKASSGAGMDASVNFGQNPSFSGSVTSGTNADDSGKGLFKYAPPTGFLALCEDNLPAPAIADPGKHFKAVLYTGDGSDGRSITGVGFRSDLVWTKERNGASGHFLIDSVRGVTNFLGSHSVADEGSSTIAIKSFDSSGYSIGDSGAFNESNKTYVAWCWKAGGAAVSNTDGSITSQVSVNQTAGFSIIEVDSLPASTTSTFGHGLNKKPDFIILKSRNNETNWDVYHSSLTPDGERKLYLNSGTGEIDSAFMGDTPPTSSVISFNPGSSISDHIVYCWSEIENYSKFGSYIGNGSNNGPFVYCGFKPAWVMVKRVTTGGSEGWPIFDSSRGPTNPNPKGIYANSNIDENDSSGRYKDFLSNGFKIRGTSGEHNSDGITYIFAAFAESPFQTANAK